MKKLFALLLTLAMVLSLAACGGKEEAPAAKEETKSKNPSIMEAKKVLRVHRIIMYIALALIVLLPVYKPLLRKVRTSIEVEATKEMGEIELDGSDE